MKKSISDLIQEALLQRGHKSIYIDDSNIFLSMVTQLGKDGRAQPGWRVVRFGLLVVTVFAMLTFLIYATVFFIRDILLFDQKPVVTEAGAIIPQRSCNREQVLFHFNAADLWARTGVQLQQGDRIRISHSGGFHSDVADIYLSASRNGRLKYPYYTHSQESSREGVENCIYNRTNDAPRRLWLLPWRWKECVEREPSFGSILWQVADENSVFNARAEDIHQIGQTDAQHFIDICKDGELFLTVNDILLTEAVAERIDSIQQAYVMTLDTALPDRPLRARDNNLQFITVRKGGQDSMIFSGNGFREELSHDESLRGIWFQDNIGSELICVEIERRTAYTHWFIRWYRYTERCMNTVCECRSVFLKALLSIGVFLWSILALVFFLVMSVASLARICWPLSVLLLIVFLPKWLRWLLSNPFRRLWKGIVDRWRRWRAIRRKAMDAVRRWYDFGPRARP